MTESASGHLVQRRLCKLIYTFLDIYGIDTIGSDKIKDRFFGCAGFNSAQIVRMSNLHIKWVQ